MSVKVLVDTSFLVAQLDEQDVHHPTARALHQRFRERDVTYVHLDCVVNEAVTVLARRAVARKVDPRPVVRRLRAEIPADIVAWTGPELPRFWERILDTLEEHRGRLSYHDCLLVLVSREGGIGWIASFDQGFDHVSGLRRVGTPSTFGGGV